MVFNCSASATTVGNRVYIFVNPARSAFFGAAAAFFCDDCRCCFHRCAAVGLVFFVLGMMNISTQQEHRRPGVLCQFDQYYMIYRVQAV